MFVPFKVKVGVRAVVLAFALGASSFSAQAVLERVGPPSNAPSIGGYPLWYQDTTGLALEFCDPKNASEAAGSWCLLLPGDLPTVPEVFPNAYFDEHFYFAAGATLIHATQAKGFLVLAQEAAFATGAPAPGAQITFARIRVKLDPVPVTGTYRFIHPYGEESIFAEAGGRIFFTDDAGINCPPGQFDCALNGRPGPFLLPAATPGGAEMPPLTATNPTPDTDPAHFGGAFVATPYPGNGKAYIADPGRIGPVTGSPLPNFVDSTGASRNHNIFRIEGPAGSNLGGAGVDYLETTDFSLMGRLYTGTMPGRVAVERATYARDALGQQVDILAAAFPTTLGRLPGQPRPAAVAPQLSFFDAPCGGVVDAAGNLRPPYTAPLGASETQMFADGNQHWGQIRPLTLPSAVCVKDGGARDVNGNVVPAFVPHNVSDQVAITQAAFDPASGSLTVAATSSDKTVPPALSLTYGTFRGALVNGQITVPGVMAPPAEVRVLSSAQGASQHRVRTGAAGAGVPAPTGNPVAVNDAYTFSEDAGAQVLAVLANDANAVGGTVAITALPALGSAVVNPDGTVSYTARLNASGTDAFAYSVTVGGVVSNTGTATLSITPVNDPPVASNDSASALVNVPVSFNVLANDTDVDGAADLVAATNLTPPTPLGATASLAGGVVTFSASAAGTYTFTYQAQDAALALSVPATVTVQVAAGETLTFSKAEYVRSKSNLRAQGTIAPAASQRVGVAFIDAAGSVLGTAGTATADAAGIWTLDTVVALPLGATALKATSSNGTVKTTALIMK